MSGRELPKRQRRPWVERVREYGQRTMAFEFDPVDVWTDEDEAWARKRFEPVRRPRQYGGRV